MTRLNNSFPLQKQLKNRSSKHLRCLTGRKPIFQCVSLDTLQRWADLEVAGALKAYNKRLDKIERRKKA